MPAFARALVDLYELAEQAGPEEFPSEVLRFLRPWVGFDGAVLGMGDACVVPVAHLEITQAHVQDRDARIVEEYGAVSASDPVTAAFVNGLREPLVVDCRTAYGNRRTDAVDAFARAHGLRHLMLFGDVPRGADAGRWLVLYRSDERAFDTADADHLHAVWLHLSRAIEQHRAALLERYATDGGQRACALVGESGRLHAADRRFVTLLQREWPSYAGGRLPAAVTDALERGAAWRGMQVEVALRSRGAVSVCIATPVQGLAGLTPGENAVARRFAAGRSSKEIARELGVSPNTVRTQLTHLYAKLGVHDKAELAQRLHGAPPAD